MSASIPLRSMTMALALGLVACDSEEAPTEPSGGARPALAAVAGYTAVDLGTLGGSNSSAFAINPAGQVVGYSVTGAGEGHAFLWSKGVMTDLGTLGGNFSRAFGIDSAGRVVGGSATAGSQGNTHAFLWTKGIMRDLGTLGGTFSEADAINPSGQVVGYSTTAQGHLHASLWQNGVMKDLGTLGGDTVGPTASAPWARSWARARLRQDASTRFSGPTAK